MCPAIVLQNAVGFHIVNDNMQVGFKAINTVKDYATSTSTRLIRYLQKRC